MKRETLQTIKIILVLFWTGLFWACSAGTGPKSYNQLDFPKELEWPQPEVQSLALDNGIRFFLLEDHELPMVKMIMKVRAGQVEVPEGKEGLAELTAKVMRSGGTADYPEEDFDYLLENRAAKFDISFDLDSGTVTLEAMKKDFEILLPKVINLLVNPLLPREKMLLNKQRMKTDIFRRREDQRKIGLIEFKRLVYGQGSVYARVPENKSLESIELKDLENFHHKVFQPQNIMIGITGDFETQKIKSKLRSVFSEFPQQKSAQLLFPEVEARISKKVHLIPKPDVNQSLVIMGHLGDYRQNPDYAALQVMNKILSGGFSGRLFQKVRTEMGLAYSVYGRYGCRYYYPGMFFVILKTKSESTAKAINVVKNELIGLQKNGLGQEELEQAKERFLNSLIFRYDQEDEVLSRRLYYEYRGMDKNSFEQLIEEIKNVTVQDVQGVAKEYIKMDRLEIVVVGKKDQVYNQLQELGKVKLVEKYQTPVHKGLDQTLP